MTEETKTSGTPENTTPETDSTVPGNPGNKSFWMGVGIGSAALVAALMYTKRPRGKRRT
jgi:hypothetical protein